MILHVVLGIASVITYWQRPDAFLSHAHARGRVIAVVTILKVFLAWIPYFVSAYYSTGALPERSPRATTAFMVIAIAVSIVAACLNFNVFHLEEAPSAWLTLAGVTIALLVAARVCASIWRKETSSGWDTDL